MPDVSGTVSEVSASLAGESDVLEIAALTQSLNPGEGLEAGDALPLQAEVLGAHEVGVDSSPNSLTTAEQTEIRGPDSQEDEEEEAQCQQQPESEEALVSSAAA